MNHPTLRFIPIILFLSVLCSCGGNEITSSAPNEKATIFLLPESTASFGITGNANNDSYFYWTTKIVSEPGNKRTIDYGYGQDLKSWQYTPGAELESALYIEVSCELSAPPLIGSERRVVASVTWEVKPDRTIVGPIWDHDLFIRNSNDLAGLEKISEVAGNVYVDNISFSSSNALVNLRSIQGDLIIENNNDLAGLAELGLLNLHHVQGIHLIDNPTFDTLSSLTAIDSLESLIVRNTGLTDFSGLDNLSRIEQLFLANENSKLENFSGLEKLTNVGRIFLASNSVLKSFTGLDQLTWVEEGLEVYNSPEITHLQHLNNIRDLSILVLSDLALINLSGLDSLTHIGQLVIDDSDNMSSFNGLLSIESIDSIEIRYNNSIKDFSGFEFLTELQSLSVQHSDINSFNGLQNITNIEGLFEVEAPDEVFEGFSQLSNLISVGEMALTLISHPVSLEPLKQIQGITGDFNAKYNTGLCTSSLEDFVQQVESQEGIGGNIEIELNGDC